MFQNTSPPNGNILMRISVRITGCKLLMSPDGVASPSLSFWNSWRVTDPLFDTCMRSSTRFFFTSVLFSLSLAANEKNIVSSFNNDRHRLAHHSLGMHHITRTVMQISRRTRSTCWATKMLWLLLVWFYNGSVGRLQFVNPLTAIFLSKFLSKISSSLVISFFYPL